MLPRRRNNITGFSLHASQRATILDVSNGLPPAMRYGFLSRVAMTLRITCGNGAATDPQVSQAIDRALRELRVVA